MNKNNLLKRAFLDAGGIVIYVVIFAWFVTHIDKLVGLPQQNVWFAPAFFLLMFIISATVTGSLFLLKPILLYVEGQKKEAFYLFTYTLGFLVLMAIIIGLLIII
jgi:hypothetical protein